MTFAAVLSRRLVSSTLACQSYNQSCPRSPTAQSLRGRSGNRVVAHLAVGSGLKEYHLSLRMTPGPGGFIDFLPTRTL